jgi:cytochrome c peroxidase
MIRGAIPLLGLSLSCLWLCFACGCESDLETEGGGSEQSQFELVFPLGLPAESAVIPADNPITVPKLKLGRRLFFDTRLSADDSLSCASCHVPEKGFADPNPLSTGIGGQKGTRHAPVIINRVFSAFQFWDGRATSLEQQATQPIGNPVEMGMPSMHKVILKLREDESYGRDFAAAFPPDGAITEANLGKALACFERTILSGDSPYDRFIAGDTSAMTESAQRGMEIFKDENRGNCETCHASFNFTDENFNNLGVGMDQPDPDLGRYAISNLEGHQGAFKTPTLREIANTAPYMHDGSMETLEEVMEFYVQGGHQNEWLSPKMKALDLSEQDQADLIEFMKALSGEMSWYGKTLPRE